MQLNSMAAWAAGICWLLAPVAIASGLPAGLTTGGEGGVTVRVTTLGDGEGSLRAALAAPGPKTVVFDVAGIIDLERQGLLIDTPFTTVAGETAPSPGITLIRGGLSVQTHDVILRHLRVRPGEAGAPKHSGWEVDGISTSRGAHRVIVDHCSLSWATDENLSASGARFDGETIEEWRLNASHDIVFSHNLIAEGLANSTHSKFEHSKGVLLHDNVTDPLSVHSTAAPTVANARTLSSTETVAESPANRPPPRPHAVFAANVQRSIVTTALSNTHTAPPFVPAEL